MLSSGRLRSDRAASSARLPAASATLCRRRPNEGVHRSHRRVAQRRAWRAPASPAADGGNSRRYGKSSRRDGGSSRQGAVRVVLRSAARGALLLLLAALLRQQALQYLAQPISTTLSPRLAPFPRFTLCPGTSLRNHSVAAAAFRRTVNGSLTVAEFYDLVTMQLRPSEHRMTLEGGVPIHSAVGSANSSLGPWKHRFYLSLADRAALPIRCATFVPSKRLDTRVSNALEISFRLRTSAMFSTPKDTAFTLYIHGAEEPNVGDLSANARNRNTPRTAVIDLRPGQRVKCQVAAKIRQLANVRRRPCSSAAGYSRALCLKQCLWRRLADRAHCRLPHMVAEVGSPSPADALRALPPCDRPLFARDQGLRKGQHERTPAGRLRPATGLTDAGGHPGAAATIGTAIPWPMLRVSRGCGCHEACSQFIYFPSNMQKMTGSSFHHTQLKIALDLAADALQESVPFTFSTLFANCAGLFGMVTGFSLFGFVDMIDGITIMFASKWINRNKVQTKHK